MYPVLFQLGPITIYSYGVLVATGVLLGIWYASRHAARAGLNPEKVWNLGIYIVFSAMIVAKVWLILAAKARRICMAMGAKRTLEAGWPLKSQEWKIETSK